VYRSRSLDWAQWLDAAARRKSWAQRLDATLWRKGWAQTHSLTLDAGCAARRTREGRTGLTKETRKAQMSNFNYAGLTAVPIIYNQSDPSTYNMKNISGQGLDRSVDGNLVTYTYYLREHRGLVDYSSSSSIVHSSSSCIGRNFFNGSVYEKGVRVGTLGKPAVLLFSRVYYLDGRIRCLRLVRGGGSCAEQPAVSPYTERPLQLFRPGDQQPLGYGLVLRPTIQPLGLRHYLSEASLMPFTFWRCVC
jgi:hypothetical protein